MTFLLGSNCSHVQPSRHKVSPPAFQQWKSLGAGTSRVGDLTDNGLGSRLGTANHDR